MTTRDQPWPEGTPAWADLVVPDRRGAKTFYGGLFGWSWTDGGPETGYYSQGHLDGRPVAGLGEALPGEGSTGSAWTTYLAADDVADVARRIVSAGGTILAGPMEVGDFGRMAIASDPARALFGVWESGEHIGARLVNVPGTMCWNEAIVGELAAARIFYPTVFGYDLLDLSGPGFEYVALQVEGRVVGGLGAVAAEMEVAPHWLTYFAVADVDATVDRAVSLGANVRGQPRDSAYGRMAVLTGPADEVFAVITPAAVPDDA
jgi:predicted enzyme related to lactoylglutathione lyase